VKRLEIIKIELFLGRLLWLLVTASCHPDGGSAMLLRNVGSYKNHTA
jgi:hypothetical protein